MLASPEFEPEFYIEQNKKMIARYEKIFKKWRAGWTMYYKDVCKRLRNREYWLWNYLVGLEKFIQEQVDQKPSKELLEQDKNSRISRIVGDFYKTENYVKGL
jgi:hypothetical protein